MNNARRVTTPHIMYEAMRAYVLNQLANAYDGDNEKQDGELEKLDQDVAQIRQLTSLTEMRQWIMSYAEDPEDLFNLLWDLMTGTSMPVTEESDNIDHANYVSETEAFATSRTLFDAVQRFIIAEFESDVEDAQEEDDDDKLEIARRQITEVKTCTSIREMLHHFTPTWKGTYNVAEDMWQIVTGQELAPADTPADNIRADMNARIIPG